jgi:D-alanyl-lipoteichoic acid acyltransferase DltB (MBOAT superfamily)
MRLDSAAFLVVFAAFFLVYAAASSRAQRVLLVLGSVAFYATLSPRFVPLLLGVGVFTFFVTARMHRETAEPRRARLLRLGVGANVAVLAFFKAAAPTAGLFATLGLRLPSSFFTVAAPIGMSFYALQAVSYVVDVHRGVYEPPKSLLSFLASFTLFPHLLSGPIVRSRFLVPLVERVGTPSFAVARRAMLLFVVGLLEKSIADRLAPAAAAAFDADRPIASLEAWAGLVAYAAELYGDFSGYTDMATAIALLLGLDLPPNFDLPYLATSPADFWRRWHISLSTWLRDYVHLPLGMRFRKRRSLNLVATWLVAGLWHGVSVPYAVYGAYHGALLAGTDWLSRRFDDDGEEPRGARRVVQTLGTFYLVLIGYVLFRARSLSAAGRMLVALHAGRPSSKPFAELAMTIAGSLFAIVACHGMDHVVRHRRDVVERPWVLWPAMLAAVVFIALRTGEVQPFIYFGF